MDGIVGSRPALRAAVDGVLRVWPAHDRFLASSLAAHDVDDLDDLERLAADVLAVAGGDRDTCCADYVWMCEVFRDEALHFARTGAYRCLSADQARREVYDDSAFMARYMRGALLSQVLWANHAQAALFFTRAFVAMLPVGCRYLEVGAGHGLFLARVAREVEGARITAWDVSAAGRQATSRALRALGVEPRVDLVARDAARPADDDACFDAITVSEVLEHLDDPVAVLASLRERLVPGGCVFVNLPINSPAPDHVFLARTPGEAEAVVTAAGLEVRQRALFPMTGYTLERALRDAATVSCVYVATRA